jgi:hypothetical protein
MALSQFVKQSRTGPLKSGPILGTTQDQINFTGTGDKTLVAAITGRRIRVHKLFIVGAAASNLRFWSGASSDNVPITGQMNFGSNFVLALDNDDFTILTDTGDALILSSSVDIQVGGLLVYSVE